MVLEHHWTALFVHHLLLKINDYIIRGLPHVLAESPNIRKKGKNKDKPFETLFAPATAASLVLYCSSRRTANLKDYLAIIVILSARVIILILW